VLLDFVGKICRVKENEEWFVFSSSAPTCIYAPLFSVSFRRPVDGYIPESVIIKLTGVVYPVKFRSS